jgi:preprotein translocase subunit YajC
MNTQEIRERALKIKRGDKLISSNGSVAFVTKVNTDGINYKINGFDNFIKINEWEALINKLLEEKLWTFNFLPDTTEGM